MGVIVLLATFWIFRHAPIQQPGDSRYAMLLADNLVRHGDFALERYQLPLGEYQTERVEGHTYYSFPPGTSVLSAPLVALLHLRGESCVNPDGTYSHKGELQIDAQLSALLMAVLAAVVYFTARTRLPFGWSLGITSVAAFGTQVFSTTSRSMWSDTWGLVLVGAAVLVLLRSAARTAAPSGWLLGILESLAYVVRPTNASVIVGTALYLALVSRRQLVIFLTTLLACGAPFIAYSSLHFHTLLPGYFSPGRLTFEHAPAAFFGNLLSPSRGLLVYVPAVLAIAAALFVYRQTFRFRRLALLAAFVVTSHLIVLAGFAHWWGGHSYGARLTASLVPWIVLLGVIAADAARTSEPPRWPRPVWPLFVAGAGFLCASSIALNAVGAYSIDAARWNYTPTDIDLSPGRLWSWRRPQFMAPWLEPTRQEP